jgi:hypothetical protein
MPRRTLSRPAPKNSPGADKALRRIRALCLALPEAMERPSHGAPTFFIRGKKSFLSFVDNHHNDGRLAIWCPAPFGMQDDLVGADPARFFVPPYVGVSGWIGMRLDLDVDWEEVAKIVHEAYRTVAPKKLLAQLDAPRGKGQVS